MSGQDFSALGPVLAALEELSIRYLIGGSVASSVHGVARPTQDFDVVAELREDQVGALVALLRDDYYADEAAIRDALARGRSFNLIAFATADKIDVFPAGSTPRDEAEMRRALPVGLMPNRAGVPVSSPEDTILRKLEWYRLGGGVSDRQWQDVLGVLKVQAGGLDDAYLRTVAAELQLTDLLDRALAEAGIQPG